MKKAFVAVSILALAGCGGSSGGPSFVDPSIVNFTYGTPAAPSAIEASAASTGALGASDAAALGDATDDAQAQSLANLPDDMASGVFGDAAGTAAVQARARAAMTRRAAAYAAGNLVAASAGFDDPACVSVSLNQIEYDHCVYTDAVDGTVITVNGTFTRQASADASEVLWDATATVSLTQPVEGGTFTMNVSNHLHGDITVTLADTDLLSIVGFARSDAAATATAPGQSMSLAFTHNADLALDYQPSADCVVGGTLELKRIWAQRPIGSTATDLPNLGVLFDFGDPASACGDVLVSWGTLK